MECASCGNETGSDERICGNCRGNAQTSESFKRDEIAKSQNNFVRVASSGGSVVVTDIQMTFGSMVVFMIKWAIASIPAAIVLGIIWLIIAGILGSIFGGIMY